MKKAKIMLTAIGVFAIVGGALAFKANRGGVIFCGTKTYAAGFCTITLQDYTTLPVLDPNAITRSHCTTIITRPCFNLVGIGYFI